MSPGGCPTVSLTFLFPLELNPETCPTLTLLHPTKSLATRAPRHSKGNPKTSLLEHRLWESTWQIYQSIILFHKLLLRFLMQMTPR